MLKTLTLTALAAALMFSEAPAYAGWSENGARMNGLSINGSVWNGAKLNGTGENGVRANGLTTNGAGQIGRPMDGAPTIQIIAVELPSAR